MFYSVLLDHLYISLSIFATKRMATMLVETDVLVIRPDKIIRVMSGSGIK